MAKTRRNRKNTMRKNRKQRGAGFFDFFKRSSAPAVALPTVNAKAPLNTNLPAAAAAAAPAAAPNAPRRSFMNRLRNTTGRVGSSLREARNTVRSTAKNYGQHMRTMRNTMRNEMRGRPANAAAGFSQNYSMK